MPSKALGKFKNRNASITALRQHLRSHIRDPNETFDIQSPKRKLGLLGKGGKGIGKGKSNVKSLVKSNAKSLGQGNTPCCQPATSQRRCCPKSTIQKHVISFAQASCSPTPSSSLRMGSLLKDTLCAYFGKRRAG